MGYASAVPPTSVALLHELAMVCLMARVWFGRPWEPVGAGHQVLGECHGRRRHPRVVP